MAELSISVIKYTGVFRVQFICSIAANFTSPHAVSLKQSDNYTILMERGFTRPSFKKVLCCTLPFSFVDWMESFPGAEVLQRWVWEQWGPGLHAMFFFPSGMGSGNRVCRPNPPPLWSALPSPTAGITRSNFHWVWRAFTQQEPSSQVACLCWSTESW